MGVAYVVTGSAVNLTIDGKVNVIHKSHANYSKVIEMLKSGDISQDKLELLMSPAKKINEFGKGKLKVKDSVVVYVNDQDEVKVTVDNSLIKRIETMMEEGFEVGPLVLFFENLMLNTSSHSVRGLYRFLENNELPLTDDGHFLAYKKVRANYKDVHTNTFDNSIGKVVEMLRNQVDEDYTRTCSTGLHFASLSYAKDFYSRHDADDHLIIVKINPKDVVAFPNDYKNAKGRACRYEVIGEVKNDGMERLLSNFQGLQDIDQLQKLFDFVRSVVEKHTPKGEDGKPTISFKLNDTLVNYGLHKERVRDVINDVRAEYNITTELTDTSVTSIYKLVNFITKEVDFSKR